ncbi:MAG: hypothetical protein PUE22_01640 [Roseburia porci]|nr:hypothetical protein [Roseburia porci]
MSLKEVLKQLGIKLIGWVKSNCVNNLLSDRADLPLAAAQGKVIDEKITALNSNITTITTIYSGHVGNDTLTVPNMSKCGTIHTRLSVGTAVLDHIEMPYNAFKRGITLRLSHYDGYKLYKQDVTYISDTQIQVLTTAETSSANLNFTVYGTL